MTQAQVSRFPLLSSGVNNIELVGSFVPNGTSTAALTTYGRGFTAFRTANVGEFKITITFPFYSFISVTGGVSIDDLLLHQAVPSALTVPTSTTNGSFLLTHITTADTHLANVAAADITASGTLRRISFRATLAISHAPGAGA